MYRRALALVLPFLTAAFPSFALGPASPPPERASSLWAAFEANLGQAPGEAVFVARYPRAFALLGPSGLDVYLSPPFHRWEEDPSCPEDSRPLAAFRLRIEGAAAGTFRPLEPLPGAVHIYHGADPSRWITGIPRYGRVLWESPLPGVEVEFLPLEEGIRFDLRLSSFADPGAVRLAVESLDGNPVAFRVALGGEAWVETAAGPFPLRLPAVWAEGSPVRRPLKGVFVSQGPKSLGFRIEGRSPGEAIVVDPTLVYSSYLGGSSYDMARSFQEDASGNLVVAGQTSSPDFPGGGSFHGVSDAFLAVFSGSTHDPIFVALVGGSGQDLANGLGEDDGGNFYLGGGTYSFDFPLVNGLDLPGGSGDGFLVRITPMGTIEYATLLGGALNDTARALAVSPAGVVGVAGATASMDFPVTDSSFNRGGYDGFLSILDTFSSGWSSLLFSTLVGGGGNDEFLAVRFCPDDTGVLYLCGKTQSPDFPVTPDGFQTSFQGGSEDGVFLKYRYSPTPGLLYSTYLGSPSSDVLYGLEAYPGGFAAVAGDTDSPSFPLVSPTQPAFGGGGTDAVVALFFTGPSPGPVFSSYLGGSGNDYAYAATRCAATADLDLLVAGATSSPDLPLLDPLPGQESLKGPEDAFLAAWTFPVMGPRRPGEPASSLHPFRTLTTYFGGGGDDWAEDVFCKTSFSSGVTTIGVAGGTDSLDFPLAGNSYQGLYGGAGDGFFSLTSSALCTLTCSASVNAPNGVAPHAAAFTATATASNCSQSPAYSWDFGDGSPPSTEQNPAHTYLSGGTYTWTLTVTADAETCTQTGTVQVCELTCSAAASEESGFAPLPVSFSSGAALLGSCNIDIFTPTFSWSFGDGGTSAEQNPTHTYNSPGTYTWTLTVSFDQATCTRTGTVEVCELTCTASASPFAGPPPLAVSFSGAASTPGSCMMDPVVSWDFGDGGTSTEWSPTHTYATAGTYTWTMTVVQGQATCTRTGTVVVSSAALYGHVGIQGDELFPLDGAGIVSATVTARNASTGAAETVPVSHGFYAFPSLPPGTYTVEAKVRYRDFIFVDAEYRGFGCPAPASGYVEKEVTRLRPGTVTVPSGGGVEADVAFPPPLVFLHGALGCYRKWYSDGPSPDAFWDNRARAEGYLTFTPNYRWWGDGVSWDLRAGQVYQQVQADLHGLDGRSGAVLGVRPYPPWNLVAYDLGGLVARVLTSGNFGALPVVESLRNLFLLGVPNSGSDFFFGGLGNGLLDTETVVRRFNEVYPDFGRWTDRVYAIAGNRGWWGTGASDGRVPLFSAFAIVRLLCREGDPSGPLCRPYASRVFDSGSGHIFPYTHDELGSPPSTADLLTGTILPRAGTAAPTPVPRRVEPLSAEDDDPLSPVGASIWGTGARSTGTKGGVINAFANGPLAAQTFDFPVGSTDGMALAVFVLDGAASFTLRDPQGTAVASASGENDLLFQVLDPAPGTWTLTVAVSSGSVTFRATSFENSPAGIEAHVTRDRYAPGEPVHYRLDLTGDPGDLSFSSVTAALLSGGSLLETVTLYDDGGHGDGLAGDGSFGGEGTAPALAGAYDVLFTARGTYDGEAVTRVARDTLVVLPAVHAFTGAFSDAGTDTDGDGLFEGLVFTAALDLPAAGSYALSGDLYDGAGYFLAHGSSAFSAAAPGPSSRSLLFDLSEAPCASFGSPLSVRNLRLLEGAGLRPLDAWEANVPTAAYPSSAFDCQPSAPGPRILSLNPDEGIQGRPMTLQVSGENFADGAAADLGAGVRVEGVSFLSPSLLELRVSVDPSAAPGMRTLTVTNPGGASQARPEAFLVKADAPPAVALLSPGESYVVLGSTPLAVAAAASDDGAVTQVAFLVDGQVRKEDLHHPFTFSLDPATLASGAHTITARAYDDRGQTAEVSFLAVKDPPEVTAVAKLTAPFRIKITGKNFQNGVRVYIGSDAQPWPQTAFKNDTKIILKGGSALKARFPKGQAVNLRLVNPDGGFCTATYTRP